METGSTEYGDAAKAPKRTLVVDDEENVLLALNCLLARRGVEVRTALTVAEALDIWARRAGKIDSVLLDVTMPPSNAAMALAKQFTGENPGVRIVYMSGYSRETLRHMGYVLGAEAAFVQKPFDVDRLISLLAD